MSLCPSTERSFTTFSTHSFITLYIILSFFLAHSLMLAIEELVTTFLKQFVRVFNSGGFENLCISQRRILVGVYNVHSLRPIDTLGFFLYFAFFAQLKTERFLSCCCIFAVYFLDIKTSVYILFPLARLCRLVVAGDSIPIRSDPLPFQLGISATWQCCRRLVLDTRQSLLFPLFFRFFGSAARFLVASFSCHCCSSAGGNKSKIKLL